MIHVNIVIPMEPQDSTLPPANRRRYGGVLPEERQRQRRAKLIDGGIEVFGGKGFHASTVREVCVAAHLTERYFYESFKSLSELFIAVYGHLRQQMMDETLGALQQQVASGQTDPMAMLDPALRVFLEFIRNDPRRGRILLVDSLGIDSEVARLSGETARDYSGLLKMHLHRIVPQGTVAVVDLDLLADGMIGLNILLAARWMQDGFVTPIDTVVRTNMLPYQGLLALVQAERQGR